MSHAGAVAALLASPCVVGCTLAVGDYAVAEGGRGGAGGASAGTGGTATQVLPVLPAQPDSERTECEPCARDSCNDLWRACVDDPYCLRSLRCKTECRDPDCLLACTDQHADPVSFDAYWACVYGADGNCVTECGPGRNLGCAGEYSWTRQEDPAISVDLEIALRWFDLEPLAGADVRVCSGLTCRGAQYRDEGETTAGGEAALDYRFPLGEGDVFGSSPTPSDASWTGPFDVCPVPSRSSDAHAKSERMATAESPDGTKDRCMPGPGGYSASHADGSLEFRPRCDAVGRQRQRHPDPGKRAFKRVPGRLVLAFAFPRGSLD